MDLEESLQQWLKIWTRLPCKNEADVLMEQAIFCDIVQKLQMQEKVWYGMYPKYANYNPMVNCVGPDQTAGAVCSGITLLASLCLWVLLPIDQMDTKMDNEIVDSKVCFWFRGENTDYKYICLFFRRDSGFRNVASRSGNHCNGKLTMSEFDLWS